MKKFGITAVGSYFPDKIVTNDDLSQILDTNDTWIRTRTGIGQRHYVEKGQGASDLAVPALQQALERRGMSAEELDLIIVATVTPDTLFPSTACRIQDRVGAKNAWGFDLSAACSSFLYALITAHGMGLSGHAKRIAVVGADVMSSIINMEDRTTAVLFGDGAGCVIMEEVQSGGMIESCLKIDGSGADNLYMPAGGSRRPASVETVANKEHFVHQNGREVFKTAVTEMANISYEVLEKQGYSGDDIDLFVPHQANIRIIESAAKRMKLPWEKVMINIDRRANTTSATLPTCLEEASQNGRLKKGDKVLLATFGAGYTWGGALLEWSF